MEIQRVMIKISFFIVCFVLFSCENANEKFAKENSQKQQTIYDSIVNIIDGKIEKTFFANDTVMIKQFYGQNTLFQEYRRIYIVENSDTISKGSLYSSTFHIAKLDKSDSIIYAVKKPKLFINKKIDLDEAFHTINTRNDTAWYNFKPNKIGNYGYVLSIVVLSKKSSKPIVFTYKLSFVSSNTRVSNQKIYETGLLKSEIIDSTTCVLPVKQNIAK